MPGKWKQFYNNMSVYVEGLVWGFYCILKRLHEMFSMLKTMWGLILILWVQDFTQTPLKRGQGYGEILVYSEISKGKGEAELIVYWQLAFSGRQQVGEGELQILGSRIQERWCYWLDALCYKTLSCLNLPGDTEVSWHDAEHNVAFSVSQGKWYWILYQLIKRRLKTWDLGHCCTNSCL